jgi:hypothetical protein
MLSVSNMHFMLSVSNMHFMLSVVKLNVAMLSVVAPFVNLHHNSNLQLKITFHMYQLRFSLNLIFLRKNAQENRACKCA